MSLEDLLRDRKIEKVAASEKQALNSIRLAKRDLETAKRNFNARDYDWCLAISYNAMLQSGKALMIAKGYRSAGQYKHIAVMEYTQAAFGVEITERLINIFNRLRKKRHRVVYEEAGAVSEQEARNALQWAEEFIYKAGEILGMQLNFKE